MPPLYSPEEEPLACLPSADLTALVTSQELLGEPPPPPGNDGGVCSSPGGCRGPVGSRHLREPDPGGHGLANSRCRVAFVLQHVTRGSPGHPPHSLATAQLGSIAHLELWLWSEAGLVERAWDAAPAFLQNPTFGGRVGSWTLSPAVHSSGRVVQPDRDSLLASPSSRWQKSLFRFLLLRMECFRH